MIVEEYFALDGVQHVRRYSNSGVQIASDDGIEYPVAEDLVSMGKVYHETSTPIEPGEGEIADKAEAYDILIGGAT